MLNHLIYDNENDVEIYELGREDSQDMAETLAIEFEDDEEFTQAYHLFSLDGVPRVERVYIDWEYVRGKRNG